MLVGRVNTTFDLISISIDHVLEPLAGKKKSSKGKNTEMKNQRGTIVSIVHICQTVRLPQFFFAFYEQ